MSTEKVDKNLLWKWEVEAILQSNELSALDKLFILTLYECGPRISENYQLIGKDIDPIPGLIHFRTNRLGKMKNRLSTRYLSLCNLSTKLVADLLSNTNGDNKALFDLDIEQNQQHDFQKFCFRINVIIKKITGRNVSLKHLRHSRARIKHLDIKNEPSLRVFFQDAGNMGHSNLSTGQKNYIQSVFEENTLIEMSDTDSASLANIKQSTLRQWRSRFQKENPNNKMKKETLNAFLVIKHLKQLLVE